MNVKMTMKSQFMRGFTFLELIVTVSIAAILLSIAIPSFTSIIQRNQITAYANEFATTVNLARSEAVKRGTDVTITSKAGVNWADGWRLTVITNGVEELLRDNAALAGDNTFVSDANDTITFNSRGSTNLGGQERWSLCNTNVTAGRRVFIAVTGRISVREITPCP